MAVKLLFRGVLLLGVVQDSFLRSFPQVFFSIRLVSVHIAHPYSRINKATAGKKYRFILSDRSHFHFIDRISSS